MAFVFARFVFGLSLAWAAVLVLLGATWVGMRLIALTVRRCDEGRQEQIVMALAVLAVAAGAVGAIYAVGHGLHGWIGRWSWLGGQADWLAGNDDLSAAAILGAMTAIALLCAIPTWLNRERPDTGSQTGGPTIRGRAAARQAALDLADSDPAPPPRRGRTGKAAVEGDGAAAKPARRAAAKKTVKGPARRTGLALAAVFLLACGGAVMWLAFSVAPASLVTGATAYQAADFMARADRAQWVFQAALLLLASGGVLGVLWYCWRRKD